MYELDRWLFLALNAGPEANALSIGAARAIAVYGIAVIPITLAADWLRGDSARRAAAATACLATIIALTINLLIGWAADLPRPSAVGVGHTFLTHADDASFPSDHATVLFTAAFVYLAAHRYRTGAVIGMLGMVVGWARVYLGVHFPEDVLGATAPALAGAAAASWLMTLIGAHIMAPAERTYRTLFAPLIVRGWVRQ